jgi:glucosamine--fructose-6-phosphate aminotransferase (isomerizing)
MNRLFADILGQPESLRGVIAHQLGAGRDDLTRAAAEVRHARRVIFAGMGSSLFACAPAVAALHAHGRSCCAVEAAELLYFERGTLSRDTAAVLVSRSGDTVEVVKLIPELRARGVHIVGVTNVAGSTLAREADVVVHVGSAPDHLVALRTYTGTTAALLALAGQAIGQPVLLNAIPDCMERLIAECMDASETWRDWLEPARFVYVLGRGASLGSVNEGALLFHESARQPAIPMSCAHFRHGPVEVVSPEFRAIVFTTQLETQELDVRLAEDLRGMGGQVRLIGRPGSLALCHWPPDFPSGHLAAILEIIPVQIAAARLAEWRGIPAASFQFAPMVTVDEAGFANPAT